MNIMFMQTCDPSKYIQMIKHTSSTIFNYCERWSCQYQLYVGIRRGLKPWHAALNRIDILNDLVNRNYKGWVFHVDADAYVNDQDFDIYKYLEDKTHMAMIAAPSGHQPPRWWDINNGVFAINLGNEIGIEIAKKWYDRLNAIDIGALENESKWGDVIDDQNELHIVLRQNPHIEESFYIDKGTINGRSQFIRQVMRAGSDFESRVDKLAYICTTTKNVDHMAERERIYSELVNAIYKVLLHRTADETGHIHALSSLMSGHRTIEEELRACVKSGEFKSKTHLFADSTG